MGRTLPSASIIFMQEKDGLKPFIRAMAPKDQRAVDELFVYANKHIAEAQFAVCELPMNVFL